MNDQQSFLALLEAAMHPKILIYSRNANLINNERYNALEYNAVMTGRLIKKSNKTTDNRTYKSCILLLVSGNYPEVAIKNTSQRLQEKILHVP